LGLGDAQWLLRDRQAALDSYRNGAQAAQQADDPWVEGFCLRQTGVILLEQDEVDQAAEAAERAIEVFRGADEKRGTGMALLTLANCHSARSDHGEAIERSREAVRLFTSIDDRWSVAWANCHLGLALTESGAHAEALGVYEDALEVFREFGNKRNQARALIGIAEAQHPLGHLPEARRSYTAAAEILQSLEDPQTADLLQRLQHLNTALNEQ
ncbi:tetratricopeptide repeat protein, partial [Actinomadura adrarensis]